MKEIVFLQDDPHRQYKKNDAGILDRYIIGEDNKPCACITLNNGRIVLAPTFHIKVLPDVKVDETNEFLKQCCLFPCEGKELKILTENDEGPTLCKNDIIKLIEALKKYVE